jgi:hypothetical protein
MELEDMVAEDMRTSIVAAIAMGAVILGSGAALAFDPGQPWCIIYTGDDARLCDYPTYASCQATASGNVGYCTPNPAFFSSTQQAYSQAYGAPSGLPAPTPRRRAY